MHAQDWVALYRKGPACYRCHQRTARPGQGPRAKGQGLRAADPWRHCTFIAAWRHCPFSPPADPAPPALGTHGPYPQQSLIPEERQRGRQPPLRAVHATPSASAPGDTPCLCVGVPRTLCLEAAHAWQRALPPNAAACAWLLTLPQTPAEGLTGGRMCCLGGGRLRSKAMCHKVAPPGWVGSLGTRTGTYMHPHMRSPCTCTHAHTHTHMHAQHTRTAALAQHTNLRTAPPFNTHRA